MKYQKRFSVSFYRFTNVLKRIVECVCVFIQYFKVYVENALLIFEFAHIQVMTTVQYGTAVVCVCHCVAINKREDRDRDLGDRK